MHDQLRPKVRSQHVLGQVIFGGTKPARDEHHVRKLQASVNFSSNVIWVV